MTQQCNAWEEKFLSAAGKETLIKSVAQAIPVYVMSVFLLPASVHQALEKVYPEVLVGCVKPPDRLL
jgi:hypothetical protein